MNADSLMFSQLGRYALRTVAVLAAQEERLTSKVLAKQTGVPSAYQSKVLRKLVKAKLLSAKKGHHGGFTLTQPPDTIRFADVLSAVGALPAAGTCVFGWGRCSGTKPCPLHDSWSELSEHVVAWAEETTLADIVPRS